jgi:hypothetical protein
MRRLAPVAAAVLALAACGESSTAGRGQPATEPANVVVLQVVTQGGFAAEAPQRGQLPQVSVFGDGRVIMLGPTTLEFPGPALPNLQEFRVTGDGLGRIIDDARNAGMLDDPPPDYGDTGITDQPTTTVTVRVDGRSRRVDVYALDFSDEVTAEQRDNRKRLTRLIQLAGDPDALRGVVIPASTRLYDPTAIGVIIRPAVSTEGEMRAWPLDDLAGVGDPYERLAGASCKVFDRGQLAAVLEAARIARDGDRWESAGATYNLQFRPLLPDQRGCDDLERPLR